jgi:hypothetical protein
MITYTGLVTLAPMYMPWGVVSAYKGDEMRFYVDSGLMPELRAPSGKPGTLAPLSGMVAQGIAARGEAPEGVSVFNPADATPSVLAVFEEPHGLAHEHPQIAFDGATGAMLGSNGATRAAAKTSTVMLGLHEGHFAGAALRVLFFLCGVMGAATVATGLVLWAVARAPQGAEAEGFGLRLVRTLNVGTIVGLPAGIAAYFLANRLLPLDLAARADWEVGTFFCAWALVAVAGALRPAESVWREGLGLVGGLFLAVPVVGALTTGLHPLAGETRFLGFDAAMIALGILLGLAARKAGQARLRPALRADAGITGGEALRA